MLVVGKASFSAPPYFGNPSWNGLGGGGEGGGGWGGGRGWGAGGVGWGTEWGWAGGGAYSIRLSCLDGEILRLKYFICRFRFFDFMARSSLVFHRNLRFI